MDTPVPETPDQPLAPVQAFSSQTEDDQQPNSGRQTQSMDQLDTIGPPLKTAGQKSKKSRQTSNMTKSASNLDDLDNLLDGISTSSMKKKSKGRDKDAFQFFSRGAKSKLRQVTEIVSNTFVVGSVSEMIPYHKYHSIKY